LEGDNNLICCLEGSQVVPYSILFFSIHFILDRQMTDGTNFYAVGRVSL
jgi:hypothetical protein